MSTVRDLGMLNVAITGQSEVGGLVGVNNGTLKNVYLTGTVTGTVDEVGGALETILLDTSHNLILLHL